MKLLFDQNISFRIEKLIEISFPNSKHVSNLNLVNVTDKEIWEFAKSSQYCIVTFDADFYDYSTLFGFPPKVIWLRLGNSSTLAIMNSLTTSKEIISEFIDDNSLKATACLEIKN